MSDATTIQHTDYFHTPPTTALVRLREEAQRRLDNEGWTSTVHLHARGEDCHGGCEDYF